MRFVELKPQFLKRDGNDSVHVDSVAEADGVMFACPKCFAKNGMSTVGVHRIVIWQYGHVPVGGLWLFGPTGYDNFELMAAPDGEGKASIQIIGGCEAHFNIHGGVIVIANAPGVGGPSW